ncbi:MAG: 16S rRNA (cytidine(1402)-2'-O)-methyltransferase [Candidatus Magnetoovum sp. WYHC-5]|nr:16S rRNA (cytidine(1402)-2'-O)-methyltransferase [Candidatus Magnetoovum sp. WYHC-5]
MKGQLYIVATPIGNLDDITLRAIKTLNYVDFIAAEDTRHSKKLLNHLGISKPMISYWREKEKVRTTEIIAKLNEGHSVALISDAGTPGISDPGGVLIRQAIEEGIEVIPVPGPSALLSAIVVSGLIADRFTFIGFVSSKPTQRKKELEALKYEDKTLVFFESPHRLVDFLCDLREIFGQRRIALCHEITKFYESFRRGPIDDIIKELDTEKIAGEYVVVVEGAVYNKITVEDGVLEVKKLIEKGISRKEAVLEVARATGLNRNLLYRQSMIE